MIARVRCYAGASYPERPVAFEQEGCWLDVTQVVAQARTLEGLVFDVLAEGGQRYRLKWTEISDEWSIERIA